MTLNERNKRMHLSLTINALREKEQNKLRGIS